MPYLNVDLDYLQHPKVIRLLALLGDNAEIYPIRLWIFAGKFHPATGCLKQCSDAEVEYIAQWKGEPGKMIAAMLTLEFLEKTDSGYQIHDWPEHCGHLAAFKKRAKSAAKARWKKYATSNARSIDKQSPKQCPILTSPILTNPSSSLGSPSLSSSGSLIPKDSSQEFKQVILDLWNGSGLKPCVKISGSIAKKLDARWREHPDPEWWQALIARVAASDFLTGRKTDFVAPLDWVLGPKNLEKIEAGNYDNDRKRDGMTRMVETFLKGGEA